MSKTVNQCDEWINQRVWNKTYIIESDSEKQHPLVTNDLMEFKSN